MGTIVEFKEVTKIFSSAYGTTKALDNVNLKIEEGDIYGVIGMSGAGKSTLIRCINLLEKPTSGQVITDGEDLTKLSEKQLRAKRKHIGMIFQHFNLLMQKNVVDNVAFPLTASGVPKKEARAKAAELLEVVGLKEKMKSYPASLSGGQMQRVAIARALAQDPKILLCDEATSALDPETTASILNLLQKINREYNITIIIITHAMSVVRRVCKHVAILSDGQIVETGLVSDVFDNPQTDEARILISKAEQSERRTKGE
ncbi:MAG: ATP-binding cassette domain-containing protein [Saccharofermentans sp.]|nr:ATP-binding cassette domain-containing protein [Saccharofermentans sp.]